ncbi:MAG: ThiF family adenylyltransferase [Phycisphaerae bacterium]|nr:ThiF family adenylyltransferase [Phycisphaerae bacterium]
MLTEKEISILAGRFSARNLAELSIEDTQAISNETGISFRAIEWYALDKAIEPLRYRRNIGTLGFDGQKKLLESTIIVCGLGGLGGHIIEQCARAGVGTIIGIDYDVFDATNLNRQLLSATDTLGKKKVDEAKKRIEKVNPAVEFKGRPCKFAEIENGDWESADIVFDCLDNIPDRISLAEKCASHNLPMIHGAIAGWYGQVAMVWPNSTILDIIYKGQKTGIEDETGTPPFTAAATASIMAAKGIKILAGKETARKEQILFFDLLENDWQTIDL